MTFTGANTAAANGGDALHPVQVPDGTVVWDQVGPTCNMPGTIVDSAAYGAATATFGTAAVALPNSGTLQALRLSNLNSQPSDNSMEYMLQNVATSASSIPPGNLTTDFTTPRNNGRFVLKLNAASVGGVAEEPNVPPANAAVSSEGGSNRIGYEVAAGIAAAAIVCGAGWYVYRRRVLR